MKETDFIKICANRMSYSYPKMKDVFKIIKQTFVDVLLCDGSITVRDIGRFSTYIAGERYINNSMSEKGYSYTPERRRMRFEHSDVFKEELNSKPISDEEREK